MAHVLHLPGVNGTFAVGLTWFHEPTEPKLKDKRKRSDELHAPWAVVSKTDGKKFQSAFCAAIDSMKPSSVAPLAAIVADAYPQPWHGIFQIDANRFWYIAVRDNHGVLPEGDRVGTYEQLAYVRDRNLQHGDWAEHSGTLQDLSTLVQGKKNHPTFKDVQSSPWKGVVIGVTALGLVGGACGGSWMWREHQAEQKRQAELARQRAIQAALAAQRNASARILPWIQQPMPAEVIAACAQAWHVQPLAVEGWKLENWHCKSNMQTLSLEVNWRRNGGVAADAPGMLLAKGETAVSSNTVPISFTAPSSHALPDVDAQRGLWSLAQRYGIALNVSPASAIAPLPGAGQSQDSAPPDPWVATPMDITLDYAPWQGLSAPLESVPGLRIADVSFDAVKGAWTATGTLYGLRGVAAKQVAAAIPSGPIATTGQAQGVQGGVKHGLP